MIISQNLQPIGIIFTKREMRFHYRQRNYLLKEIAGGNKINTDLLRMTHAPSWDEKQGHWNIFLNCNIIGIDLSDQLHTFRSFDSRTYEFQNMQIVNNSRKSHPSFAQLIPKENKKTSEPRFPADFILNMHIRAIIPGKPNLISIKPARYILRNLNSWPPPVGSNFEQEEDISFYPEWIPFVEFFFRPTVIVKAGDATVITGHFHETIRSQDEKTIANGIQKWIKKLVDQLT